MLFIEIDHPRTPDGTFTIKVQSAPEVDGLEPESAYLRQFSSEYGFVSYVPSTYTHMCYRSRTEHMIAEVDVPYCIMCSKVFPEFRAIPKTEAA